MAEGDRLARLTLGNHRRPSAAMKGLGASPGTRPAAHDGQGETTAMALEVPPEISFHGIEPSEELERQIRDRIAGLEMLYDRLTACRVIVGVPHRKPGAATPSVTIELSLPSAGNIIVNREPHRPKEQYRNTSLYRVVRDSFDAAERQLKSFAEQRRSQSAPRGEPLAGTVREIRPDDDFGFLISAEGRELYFHGNAVLNGSLADLRPGDHVHYVETVGVTGPQASRVWLAATPSA